jgi:hypothetical protein
VTFIYFHIKAMDKLEKDYQDVLKNMNIPLTNRPGVGSN